MPISHQSDLRRKLVVSRASGVLTAQEVIEGQRALRGSEQFRPDHAQVLDVSAVTEVAFTEDDVLTIIANSPFGAGARRVLVIPPELHQSNLGLIAALVREMGRTLKVVENEIEAFQWLASPDSPP